MMVNVRNKNKPKLDQTIGHVDEPLTDPEISWDDLNIEYGYYWSTKSKSQRKLKKLLYVIDDVSPLEDLFVSPSVDDDEGQGIEEEEYENLNLVGKTVWKKSDLITKRNEWIIQNALQSQYNKRSKVIDTTKAVSNYITLKNWNIRNLKDTKAENILSILNNKDVLFKDTTTLLEIMIQEKLLIIFI